MYAILFFALGLAISRWVFSTFEEMLALVLSFPIVGIFGGIAVGCLLGRHKLWAAAGLGLGILLAVAFIIYLCVTWPQAMG
jgi:hypothetical protein